MMSPMAEWSKALLVPSPVRAPVRAATLCTRSGVRVCGRNRTEAREREWAEGKSTGHVKRSDKILP